MSLTSDQLSYIRDNCTDDTTPYKLSDTVLTTIYSSTTEGNGDLDTTVYYALRRLRGKLAKLISETTPQTGTTIQAQQYYEHVTDLLKEWGARVGLGGGVLLGSNSVNTYRADSDQTEEPDYSNGAL